MHENTIAPPIGESATEYQAESIPATTPLPIATSGDLNLMPPATGLPEPRSGIDPLLDAIPRTPNPAQAAEQAAEQPEDHPNEATYHG
jgi:sec-independent protein translocase protein TatB